MPEYNQMSSRGFSIDLHHLPLFYISFLTTAGGFSSFYFLPNDGDLYICIDFLSKVITFMYHHKLAFVRSFRLFVSLVFRPNKTSFDGFFFTHFLSTYYFDSCFVSILEAIWNDFLLVYPAPPFFLNHGVNQVRKLLI